MLLIPCPYCGERPEIEFTHGGEAHLTRPAPQVDTETWTQFLYMRKNTKALRDTTTDHFVAVYKSGEARPQ